MTAAHLIVGLAVLFVGGIVLTLWACGRAAKNGVPMPVLWGLRDETETEAADRAWIEALSAPIDEHADHTFQALCVERWENEMREL